ncbi:MAG: hypothetical protein HUU06_03845, partial [Planctomycetaceae bacterium]|nr:hypothetical protein [Planctomycetaceae bacterium]
MAAPVGAVRAEISASAVKFYAEMERVRQSAKKTGTSFGDMGKNLQGLGKSRETFTALVGGLSGVGGKAGVAASKLIEFVSAGLNPVVLGVTAVTTGLALWINRSQQLAKVNEDLTRSQDAFAKSMAMTTAELRDAAGGTKTAGIVGLEADLRAAKAAQAKAEAELRAGFGNRSTRAGDIYEGVARAYGTRQEELQAAFEKARMDTLRIENDLAAERKKIQIAAAKEVQEAEARRVESSFQARLKKEKELDAEVLAIQKARGEASAKAEEEQHRRLISQLEEERKLQQEITAEVKRQAAAREQFISSLQEEGFWARRMAGLSDRDAERLRLAKEMREAKDRVLEMGGERTDLIAVEKEFNERRAALEARFRKEDADAAAAELAKSEAAATKALGTVKVAVSETALAAKEGISSGLANAFVGAATGAQKLGASVKSVAASVISDLVRMTIQAFIFKQVLGGATGGGFMSFLGGGAGAGGGGGGQGLSLLQPKTAGLQVVVNNHSGAPVAAMESRGPDGQRQLEILVGEAVARDFGRG